MAEIKKSVYNDYFTAQKRISHVVHSKIILGYLKQNNISIHSLVKQLNTNGFNYKYSNVYTALHNRWKRYNAFTWFIPLYNTLNIQLNTHSDVELLQLFIDSNEYINNNLGANKYQPFVLKYPKQ